MPFKIPESYLAYCTDRAVKLAVEHILESETPGVPADLEWNDLPEFHRAVLSAHQVQCECAIFLHELWNEVWQPALEGDDLDGVFELWKISDVEDWLDQKLDMYTIWEEKWFGRIFDITGTNFQLALGTSADTESVRLSFNLWDKVNKEDYTIQLELDNHWLRSDIDDEGFAYSSKKLAPIVDDGNIDLAPLREAAADALAAVERFCRPD